MDCPVCEGTGLLLDKCCPLCDGEPLVEPQGPHRVISASLGPEEEEEDESQDPIELVIRSISGDILAHLDADGSWTVETLVDILEAKCNALLLPNTRYKLIHGAETLWSGMVLRQKISGSNVELTAVLQTVWCLSPYAKTHYVDLCEDRISARTSKRGAQNANRGIVLSESPVPWISGVKAFEVVIDEMRSDEYGWGDEGVEVGITTTTPDDWLLSRDVSHACCHEPSWVSSDQGRLWVDGQDVVPSTYWCTRKPNDLCEGDVVRFAVLPDGQVDVFVNDIHQAKWSAGVTTECDLYAIVGMQPPCFAVTVRLPAP